MPRDQHGGRRRTRPKLDKTQPRIEDDPDGPGVGMAKVLSHPLRFKILIAMNTPFRRLSPSSYAEEAGETVSNAAYHFRVLDKAGCIKIVKTIPRRGANEHIYEPIKRAMAWTREWEALGPYVRQHVAANALAPAVEKLGDSIDKGTFDKRDDSHLSWDTFFTDEEGWVELHTQYREHLEGLMATTQRIKERLDANPELARFPATYLNATFENPPVRSGEDENDAAAA